MVEDDNDPDHNMNRNGDCVRGFASKHVFDVGVSLSTPVFLDVVVDFKLFVISLSSGSVVFIIIVLFLSSGVMVFMVFMVIGLF